ncbi:MAG: class I SAM-dependent methyltransferase [Candidatus Hermodarchaeota archaeon]
MIYLDPVRNQLIYVEKVPTSKFWDTHWTVEKEIRNQILGIKESIVSRITKIYLKPENGIILEGGCGKGHHVATLRNNGYRAIGLDFAKETVEKLNEYIPELDIRYGDVRKIPFDNNYFIGYWSFGVIEHFWEDYESIALEMHRVIKKNGYLFLSFPYMSPLRNFKAIFGFYSIWNGKRPQNFYQYALNSHLVIKEFEKLGFKLIKTIPHDGIKGTKDEIKIIRPLLQRIYDFKGNNILNYYSKRILFKVLSPFASHMIILIFRKIY